MLPDVVRQEPAVAALVAAIRGPAAQLASDEALRAVLAGTGVARGDPSGMALVGQRARFELHRELVRGRFRGALEVSIPHSLGRIAPARRDEMLEAFIEERASRSPYLRDVAREFVEWAMPLWREQRDLPPYLGDLARFELLSFEVGAGPDDSSPSGSRVAADSPIDVQVAARLEHFDHAVHLLANDELVDPSRKAEPRGCWVLA
ncbi:MAG: putative DNA-binding domain-containing protein [Polyangiaceae bacterium]|nr:putative DNA-binding domain-containing protein [Polyangiaceae bacterium]